MKPFRYHTAKRRLLYTLPFEMWREVLGCARADDYLQSMWVSSEYYVLMRSSAREVLMAPWLGPSRCFVPVDVFVSARLWAKSRLGCRLAKIRLERKSFVMCNFLFTLLSLASALSVKYREGRHDVLFLVPSEMPQVLLSELTESNHLWAEVRG